MHDRARRVHGLRLKPQLQPEAQVQQYKRNRTPYTVHTAAHTETNSRVVGILSGTLYFCTQSRVCSMNPYSEHHSTLMSAVLAYCEVGRTHTSRARFTCTLHVAGIIPTVPYPSLRTCTMRTVRTAAEAGRRWAAEAGLGGANGNAANDAALAPSVLVFGKPMPRPPPLDTDRVGPGAALGRGGLEARAAGTPRPWPAVRAASSFAVEALALREAWPAYSCSTV